MISSLSDVQVKKIEEYNKKYIDIGFDTNNINDNEIHNIINNIYTILLNKPKPETIIIKDSPKACWDYICDVIGSKINFVYSYFSGHTDVNIFAFYDFMINELGVKINIDLLNKYKIWYEIVKIGMIFPFDDECIVSRKPVEYHKKGNIIHNENGPAIRYGDGFEVYILNGVRVKKEYVMTPWNKLDCNLVIKEKNAEVRRELVRKIGVERIIKELGGVVFDKKDNYELIGLDIGDGRIRPYLKMLNPSIGVYHIEGVHPDCKTVEAALEFRNGTKEIPTQLS